MSSAASLSRTLDCNNIDIAFITEHKLFEHSKNFMDSVHSSYRNITMCDQKFDMYGSIHCGKGGVSIMYKTSLDFSIRKLDEVSNERMLGVEISCQNNVKIFAFCIYMPASNYPNVDYAESIDTLQAICNSYAGLGTVVLLGDMNGEVTNCVRQTYRDTVLSNFLQRNEMLSLARLPCHDGPDYTFVTMEKTLDHVIMYNNEIDLVRHVETLCGDLYNVSDHLPVLTVLSTPYVQTVNVTRRVCIAWHKVSTDDVNNYQLTLSTLLDQVNTDDIDLMYELIVKSIISAAESALPKTKLNRHAKPYWTSDVKAAHETQREARKRWLNEGQPRGMQHDSYAQYKHMKSEFVKVQKRAIQNVETQFLQQLNNAAECDNKLFWGLVKMRRGKKLLTCNQLETSNGISRDPDTIAEGFTDYFKDVYSPLECEYFDTDFKHYIENEVHKLKGRNNTMVNSPELNPTLTSEQIEKYTRTLNLGKAASFDRIFNEHLRHGGTALHLMLAKLFNQIIRKRKFPCMCKRGLIIPVYKDNGKPRSDPRNYRPITLLPVIYKLLEKILHDTLNKWIQRNNIQIPNHQQNAYQKNTGAITASFNLQETIHYNSELHSKVYVAMLDTRQAFDSVWLDAVFYKLSDIGIHGTLWALLVDAHSDMSSCIVANGIQSSFFNVHQGIRQGGIISTWIYNLFIDELLHTLERSGHGTTLLGCATGNTTLADDIALSSTSPSGLQHMLNLTYRYTCKYRYVLNASKSFVIVFSNDSHRHHDLQLHLGHDVIQQTQNVKHVGVFLNSKLSNKDKIENACRKAKASFFSLLSIRLHTDYVNPLTSAALVSKVCIPTLLFGSELWNNLTTAEYLKLERFVRMAVKKIQRFPTRTRTDMCLSMLGWKCIQSEIDYRKLSFLGSLCRLPIPVLTREVFNARLSMYVCRTDNNQRGYIPDVVTVLSKYSLSNTLIAYIQTGSFPSKYTWKRMCKTSIHSVETVAWTRRLNTDDDFQRFRSLHTNIEPALLWECATEYDSIRAASDVSKLWIAQGALTNVTQLCQICGMVFQNELTHVLFECAHTSHERNNFSQYVQSTLGQTTVMEISTGNNESKLQCLIGRKLRSVLDKKVHKHFLRIAIIHVSKCMHIARNLYN
ncbi:MAG: reverse transcriptase family protein [Sedimenticola sp.]